MRPGEQEGKPVSADTETLKDIGFDPADLVGLREGLKQTIAYFLTEEGKSWHRP
jgi:hypothetical protein